MDLNSFPKFFIRGNIGPNDPMMDLFGEGPGTSANDVREFIDNNKEAKELVFEISSDGGYVAEGFEMFDIIKNCGKKITTIGYRVNSIAVMPFLAGSKRYISENAEFVIHNARIDAFDLGGAYLTAEDLSFMAADIAKTDRRILDAYCDILGEDKRSELLALMGADSDIGSKKAIKLGFAHGLWKAKEEAKKEKNYINCIDPFWIDKKELFQNILQNKKMENEKLKTLEENQKKHEGLLTRLINSFKTTLKIKNEVSLELEDGTLISVSGDGELVGQTALIVVDGLPTDPAPDGDHKLKDGRTITVSGGVITAVAEAENVAAMKEEISNLKAQLEAKNAENVALNEKINKVSEENTAKLNEIETAFKNFKAAVPGDLEDKKIVPVIPINQNLTPAQKEAQRIYNEQKKRFNK